MMTMTRWGWVASAALALAAPAGAQEVHRVTGGDVAIYNLAGQVRVVAGSSSDVVVRMTRGGSDAGELTVETGIIEGRSTLRVIYPSDEIVYPAMGRRSRTQFSVDRDGTFGDGGDRRDRVEIRGAGGGLEAWADLVVEVPANGRAAVYVAAGDMDATGVNATLRLDIGSGQVSATNMSGALTIDTGSGAVEVRGVRGMLDVDTGSGSVVVSDVVGDAVNLETGSGGITGSGIEAPTLTVDTGSGRIDLSRVTSASVMVDTGSGSVELELLEDVDLLEIDTGSGSVTVTAPSDLGATVEIDTGSGGIDLDFPLEVRSVRRDRVQGRLGDGDGSIVIDTGSGSVRIVRGGSI